MEPGGASGGSPRYRQGLRLLCSGEGERMLGRAKSSSMKFVLQDHSNRDSQSSETGNDWMSSTLRIEPVKIPHLVQGQRILNALTIDGEDYYQVSGFESKILFEQWP